MLRPGGRGRALISVPWLFHAAREACSTAHAVCFIAPGVFSVLWPGGRERTHLPFYGFLIFRSEKGSVLRRASFANKPAQNTGSFPYKPPKHRTFLKSNFYAKEFLSYKNQRCHPVKKAPRSFRHSKPGNSANWRSFPLSQASGHGQTAFAAHPDFGKNPKPKSTPPFFGTPTRGRSAQRCCAEPSRFARRRIGVRAPEPGKAASPIFASRHLQSR